MPRDMRPILIFALVLLAFGLLTPYLFLGPTPFNFYRGNPAARPQIFLYGAILASALYAVIGLAVLLRLRLGYVLFKGFLYLFLLSFPVGTAISWLTLSYMKKHDIKRHFGFRS
jgi:uncharacterized membrane protein